MYYITVKAPLTVPLYLYLQNIDTYNGTVRGALTITYDIFMPTWSMYIQPFLLFALGGAGFATLVYVLSSCLIFLTKIQNFFTLASAWPGGTFALPKSVDGCPSGSIGDGYVYQDNEDDNNQNNKSDPFSVSGRFRRNTRTNYCTFSSCSQSSWPNGTYCIAMFGRSCPDGFGRGFVYWDDENDNNINWAHGSVPFGTFFQNTKLYYCCRSDGSISTPISLPTGTSFYLLQKSSAGCQRVAGLTDRRDWLCTDDENNNNHNHKYGNVPYITGTSDYKIHYCYYY